MEFGLKKCGVLVMRNWMTLKMNGVTLSDGQVMKEADKTGYKYLGVIEMDKIKEQEMMDIFASECKRRLKLMFKSKH